MIQLNELSVRFGAQTVLDNCSLTAEKGTHIAFTGPSGCGKTTLINVIAGLTKPDTGSVSVEGRVSYVFQETALFPWLTAMENINVVLSDGPSTRDTALSWLKEVGLADCAHKYPHQLSGGQKQRVAICRALAYGGDILLLDEPMKGLDQETREKSAALIRRVWADRTLLLVTHDPWEAEVLCERVYSFENGKFV